MCLGACSRRHHRTISTSSRLSKNANAALLTCLLRVDPLNSGIKRIYTWTTVSDNLEVDGVFTPLLSVPWVNIETVRVPYPDIWDGIRHVCMIWTLLPSEFPWDGSNYVSRFTGRRVLPIIQDCYPTSNSQSILLHPGLNHSTALLKSTTGPWTYHFSPSLSKVTSSFPSQPSQLFFRVAAPSPRHRFWNM